MKAKKAKLKPIRDISQPAGLKLARDEVMKLMTKMGVTVGVQGLQAVEDTGAVGQSVSWAPKGHKQEPLRKGGGEAAARPSPPPWLEAELWNPLQGSLQTMVHCGARTTMVQVTCSGVLLTCAPPNTKATTTWLLVSPLQHYPCPPARSFITDNRELTVRHLAP